MCHHLNLKIQKDTWILNLNASASRGVSFVFCTYHLSSYCSCHPSLSCSALAIRHGLRQSVELHRSYLFPSSVHCSTFFTSSSATFLFPKPLLCFRTNFPTLHPFCRHQFSCRTLMRTKKTPKKRVSLCEAVAARLRPIASLSLRHMHDKTMWSNDVLRTSTIMTYAFSTLSFCACVFVHTRKSEDQTSRGAHW